MDLDEMRRRVYGCYTTRHFISASRRNLATMKNYRWRAKGYAKNYGPLLADLPEGSRALDLGCGCGHCVYYLQECGFEATGVDVSDEQIAEAGKLLPPGSLCVEDARTYLERHEGVFDVIVSNDVMEHFTAPEALAMCDLIYRALKPGGRFVFRATNASAYLGLSSRYIDLTHMTSYTEMSVRQLLSAAGFHDTRALGWHSPLRTVPGVLTRIARKTALAVYWMWRKMHAINYPHRVLTTDLIGYGVKPADGQAPAS